MITNQPIKKVISSPALSGRLTAWAIEPSEFEIKFTPRTSIKAQTLADFVAECTVEEKVDEGSVITEKDKFADPNASWWELYVDGSRNQKGSGAGILIIEPRGIQIEYSLRFEFDATNNESEYEAMVTGLRLVKSLGVRNVIVRGDSKLIIEQINGQCSVKNEVLARYKEKVIEATRGFDGIIFQHIPRT